jgi:Tfp pilus assembly PilM family ATPase
MDFGFSRFLEMFEERFGRLSTTLLMGALAIAVLSWAIQTTIEAGVYIYGLIKAAHFLAVLETEHAATHLAILAVQIAVTFLVLTFIWRWFYSRKIKSVEDQLETARVKIEGKLAEAQKRTAEFKADVERREEALNQQVKDLLERMVSLKATHEKLLAERAKPPDALKLD